MSLLPILVSIFTFNKRKQLRDAQDNNQNNADKPAHTKIDIPLSDTLDTRSAPSTNLEKPINYRTAPRGRPMSGRIDSISAASMTIVKKPYTLSRRVLHAFHQFIFEPDKALTEGYAPKYRTLPIISGLVVPFSILLEVPGLTEHWYERQEGLVVVEYQANPQILDIGLGFSIASALLANLCLILRFLERRIKSATIAAICLLLIHDTINIIALVSFGVIHAVDDGFTYSQAYYVTLASTITSLVVTTTLILDYFRTPNFTKSGSGLTRKQRSLVIIVMVLLSYLGFGALIYCFMMGIHFLDALYFVVCSTLTIGFGDIAPDNTGSRVFSIIYNTFGILNTGLAIAIARETVVEAFQQSYRNRRHALAARRKLHRQLHAKHHAPRHGLWLTHRIHSYHSDGADHSIPPTPRVDPIEDGYKQVRPPREGSPTPSTREKEAGREELVSDPDHVEKLQEKTGGENDPSSMEAPPKAESSKKPFERTNTMMSARSGRSRTITINSVTPSRTAERGNDVKSPFGSQTVGDIVDAEHEQALEQVVSGFGDEDAEYIKFRQDMINEERKEFKAKLLVSWGLFVVFWVFGGVIFMLTEEWSYGIAMYFCFTAFSTIGYGDYAPVSGPGRVCFVAWSLLGVGTMTILVSVLSEAYQSRYSTIMHNGLFDKAIRSYQNKTHSQKHTSHPDTPTYDKETMTVAERRIALDETRAQMASIPPKIIGQAKVFHAHLQYVLTHHNQEKPPPGLQRALDELMNEEEMNEDLRKEVLQDVEARRTLFMMSFERTIKRMVENAERVSKLIQERDSLEEGLGWGLERDDDEILDPDADDDEIQDQDDDEGDDDMAQGDDTFDDPASNSSKAHDPSGKKRSAAMAQWLKLRTGIMLSPKSRRSQTNPNTNVNNPYMHASGSRSEPRFMWAEEEEEEGVREPEPEPEDKDTEAALDCGDGSKGESGGASGSGSLTPGRRYQPPFPRQASKLSAVRFADNPYGDYQSPTSENTVPDNVIIGER